MEIFFRDPDEVPLPPDEVRIRELAANPYPDGRRVRVYLELTPFQQQPDAEVRVLDAQGQQVASASIIETIDPRMEMTIHLRNPDASGPFTVEAVVFYRQEAPADGSAQDQAEALPRPVLQVVDRSQTTFALP